MRLAIVTDTWTPQVNGVVTVLRALVRELDALGVETEIVHPGLGSTFALPGYREIRVSRQPWRVGQWLRNARPDFVHLATEGPLGWAARRWLRAAKWRFTSAIHSKFPEYVQLRTGIPASLGYGLLRRFHASSAALLVQSESQRRDLHERRFENMTVVGGGVDLKRFQPSCSSNGTTRREGALFVGRVAIEKGLPAFLSLRTAMPKIVVGDGPARAELQRLHPDVAFRGYLHGAELVRAYANAEVLVFPSRTDTFGLVLLEALACGTPVAAYPVTGPVDIVEDGISGALDSDLGRAVVRAAGVDPSACRKRASQFAWPDVARRFLALQVPTCPHRGAVAVALP